MENKANALFEVSFEVCNKVGGIYAVLESKAARMVEIYGNNYFAIGPYYPEKATLETVKQKPPEFFEKAFSMLENNGIKCHYGKWLIQGRPNVILIEFGDVLKRVNDIKKELWEKYKVDSLGSGFDFDEPIAWSTAVGMLIEKLLPYFENKGVVVQCHEWLAGGALLYLKNKVPTVFTTHATMLGRTIAGGGEDLYKEISYAMGNNISLDPKRPYKYGIQAKHLMEKACAENADIFSTTSEITSKEATYILGKRPDAILPNGLDIERYPTMEEFALLHRKYREKIKQFLNAYFNPFYKTELWDAMIFFTSGRYEFRNKGYDVFIDALGKLNEKMKKENTKHNVFAFFFVPRGETRENIELMESIRLFDDMRVFVNDEMPWIEETTLNSIAEGRMPKMDSVFRKEFLEECRRKIAAFKKKGTPPLSALNIEGGDSILNAFTKNNLLNREGDKVKVIFYPSYLSTTDRLLGLDYSQLVQGSHLGVFPSYYEPWGYTPLECAANGVLSVTSDLAGFGIFINQNSDQSKKPGIMVLERDGKAYDEIVQKLYDMLWYVVSLNRNERIPKKAQAKDLASLADWKILVNNYIQSHNMALERFRRH
jgi:glycogen(starch) synthase